MNTVQRWMTRWASAGASVVLIVVTVGVLWTHNWTLFAVAMVLQVILSGTQRRRLQRKPSLYEAGGSAGDDVELAEGQAWTGGGSFPGRLRAGPLNTRVNVGQGRAELTLAGGRVSLVVRGDTLESVMSAPLRGVAPADGMALFPARPFLARRGLGMQRPGGEAYYFFPKQVSRVQVLLALEAAGFRIDPRERRPLHH